MMGDAAAAGHSEDLESDYEVRNSFDLGQDLLGLHALHWG